MPPCGSTIGSHNAAAAGPAAATITSRSLHPDDGVPDGSVLHHRAQAQVRVTGQVDEAGRRHRRGVRLVERVACRRTSQPDGPDTEPGVPLERPGRRTVADARRRPWSVARRPPRGHSNSSSRRSIVSTVGENEPPPTNAMVPVTSGLLSEVSAFEVDAFEVDDSHAREFVADGHAPRSSHHRSHAQEVIPLPLDDPQHPEIALGSRWAAVGSP